MGRADAGSTVALIFLDEIRLADGIARLVGLKERQPNLRTLVAFGALTADDLRALLAAGADAFVARSKSPRELCAALLALDRRKREPCHSPGVPIGATGLVVRLQLDSPV